MPKVSLVVCVYKERDLLERLLARTKECYDDLVVIHDGPEQGQPHWKPRPPDPALAIDWAIVPANSPLPNLFLANQSEEQPGSLREFVRLQGGRFYEHPRIGSLEGQTPFAWWAAKHDWILRLDADEFPSPELSQWLKHFREQPEPSPTISGYTCIWPPWNGRKQPTHRIPEWRPFLIHRLRISYFGLTEQGPIPDHSWAPTGLILHHQPKRKSYGPGNLIFRKQAYLWRKMIALSLQRNPLDLPRWRWTSPLWPPYWEQIRTHPLRSACTRFLPSIPREYLYMKRHGHDFLLEAALGTALHKMLIPLTFWYYKYFHRD